jgi:hypothetical protein
VSSRPVCAAVAAAARALVTRRAVAPGRRRAFKIVCVAALLRPIIVARRKLLPARGATHTRSLTRRRRETHCDERDERGSRNESMMRTKKARPTIPAALVSHAPSPCNMVIDPD